MGASGQVQSDPRDIHAKKELNEAGRNIKEKVGSILLVTTKVQPWSKPATVLCFINLVPALFMQ